MNTPLPCAKRFAVRLDPALLALLRGEAEKRGVKPAAVLREALAAYLGRPDLAEVNPPGNPSPKGEDGRFPAAPL